MNVGFLETRTQKNDKGEEKGFLNMTINLPFYPKSEFFCVENKEKETDKSPDYLVFFQKNRVGSILNKTFMDKKENVEKMMRSGTIFFFGAKENNLNFAVFKNEKTGVEVVTVRARERDGEEIQTAEENLPDDVF